jgi:hypothetical protein
MIEFEDNDGDLNTVDLMEAGNSVWTPMAHNWGAMWRLNNDRRIRASFGLWLTSNSGKVFVANNAIPAAWKPDKTYRSLVKYPLVACSCQWSNVRLILRREMCAS